MNNQRIVIRNFLTKGSFGMYLVGILGVIVTALLFSRELYVVEEKIRSSLEEASLERAQAIKHEINENINIVFNVQAFFQASEKITRSEFNKYVTRYFNSNHDIQALEWIPAVKSSQKEMFIKRAIDEGFVDFQFTEKNPDGLLVKAAPRAEYFPVYYLEPFIGNEKSFGYDLGSDSTRLKAITKARDTGKLTISGKINLVQKAGRVSGILAFVPVYENITNENNNGEQQKNGAEKLSGLVLGVYSIENLLTAALSEYPDAGLNISLFDLSVPHEPEYLTGIYDLEKDQELTDSNILSSLKADKYFSQSFDVADKRWEIVFLPRRQFIEAIPNNSNIILILGISLTLITMFFYKIISLGISSRMQAEKALKESERGLKSAMRIAKLGAWEWNILTDETVLSDEYCEIFNLEKDKPYGTDDYIKLLHPDDREEQLSIIEKSIKDKKGLSSKYRIVLNDNAIKHIHSEWEVYTDSENNAVKMAGTVQDITALEETTQILLKERNHFDKLLESLGEVVFIVKLPERVIERVNQQVKNVTGYESSECIGQSTRMFYRNDQDFNNFGSKLQEAIKRGDEVVYLKQTLLKKDGNSFPSEITVSFVREDDVITHVISVIRDVSERVESELALREAKDKLEERVKERTLELEKSNQSLAENEERFRKVFQEGPLGMAIVNEKLKFVRTNKILRNMLGYNEEELSGMTFVDITHDKDKRKDTDGIKDLFKGKIPVYQTEKQYVKKNGDTLWANLTASAIFSKDKKFLYAVSMIEDIGDRKIAEQKIKRSLREKEVLLKEIHHRVKNNLQMISSLLNLQANSIKDKKIIKNLMDMKSRVLSMSLIHENIYQSEDLSEVDINNYVTMLTENLIQTYSQEGKSVKIKNKVGKITLDIDRAIPLGLIITELVTNAMQHAFTKKKGGIINISMSEINNTLEMTVSDNGDGLAKGTGINEKGNLGFMLVKTLSEQLDADLDVKVGNGTKYTMSFTK